MAAAVCSTTAGGAYENYENYENYEICCWGAVCVAVPCGKSMRPSQTTLRQSKPSGYNMTCRGVARQGEDGRPHHHLINLISLMQASHPRSTHTPVAIKQVEHTPVATLPPQKPRGIPTHPTQPTKIKAKKSPKAFNAKGQNFFTDGKISFPIFQPSF